MTTLQMAHLALLVIQWVVSMVLGKHTKNLCTHINRSGKAIPPVVPSATSEAACEAACKPP